MDKRLITISIAVTIALPLFWGCSGDEDCLQTSEDRIPMSVATYLESQRIDDLSETDQRTRTRFTGEGSGTQGTEILPGQTVWVWANYAETKNGHTDDDPYLAAWKLTSGSAGQLSGVVTTTLSGSLRYYPTQNELIDLYGVLGNFSESIVEQTTTFPATLTHTINATQTTSSSYATSDLLWGIKENQQYTEDAETHEIIAETIVIPFKHCLSKVEVTLALADGETVYTTDDLKAAKVELMHVRPTVTLTMADGSLSAASGDEMMVTMKSANSTAGYSGDWLEAIVPPQTFASASAFICVTMNVNGAERPLYYVPSSALTLAANHRYRFSFVVSSQAITLGSVTYDDWQPATSISPIPVS